MNQQRKEEGVFERARGRWQEMSGLEKVAVAGIATVGVAGAAVALAPSLASATAGGALAAAGAYLLNSGFRG